VPEVADRVITIEAIAREPGHRTKVAVSSMDSRVDAVGACVGIRGSRIKNIVEEVAGEKIDIVRYNESPQVFIANALKPAEVKEILLNRDINRATVLVAEDQLSLAIGKKGQNVRLAARLTGWNIDIMTPAEYDQQRTKAVEQLSTLEAVGPDLAAELVAAGYISIADVAEVSPEVLARASGLDAEHAQRIVEQTAALVAELEARAAEERRAAEAEAAQAAEAPTQEAEAAQAAEAPTQEAEASTETPAETVEATPETPDQEEAETVQTGPPGLGEPEGTEAEETTRPGQPPPEAEAPAGEPETTAGPAEHPPEAPGPDPAATEA
jgi:N utilization substance protein A